MTEIQILDKTFTPYIEEKQIQHRIKEIAEQINSEYEEKYPLFLGVLNGSFIFASDLFKNIDIPAEISFVKLASYKGTKSTGNVMTLIGLDDSIKDRNVIVIEDIVDTGKTLIELRHALEEKSPQSISIVTLLDKTEARQHPVDIDYSGFQIENLFVVGYGLDYDGYGRNMKDIYQLKS